VRVIVVLLFAAACGGSAKPEPAAPCNEAPPRTQKVANEADLDALRERFCECGEDRACHAAMIAELQTTLAPVWLAADFESKLEGCYIADGATRELQVLRDRACACRDVACAEALQRDFDAFLEKHKDTKGSQKQAEEVGKLAGEMSECLANAMQP
jgi:hypothetical protein